MRATVKDVESLPLVLTVLQVQELLGVSKAVAYRLTHLKKFPALRIGRSVKVPREALIRWLDAQAGGGNGAK